jgi:N utilization substance protein B
MSRKDARELAFKTIYSKFFNTEADFTEETENSEVKDLEFTTKILKNFAEHYQEVNEKISSHLKGYTIERLYKIDLAILVLAVIELDYIKENPKQVVINEAVELAKKFSTDKSPKFINGVLADIVK